MFLIALCDIVFLGSCDDSGSSYLNVSGDFDAFRFFFGGPFDDEDPPC